MFHNFFLYLRRMALMAAGLVLAGSINCSLAQSTAAPQGVVTDASGAVLPGAKIVVYNLATGEERTVESDSAGVYVVPSLPVAMYRVLVSAPGMQSVVVNNALLEVGQTTAQNFSLRVAATSEALEVQATAPVVTSETVTLGEVMDQQTVQEIPLNGRHFLDMGFLIPGSVTPPQNANLAAPLRGQGFLDSTPPGGARIHDQLHGQRNQPERFRRWQPDYVPAHYWHHRRV